MVSILPLNGNRVVSLLHPTTGINLQHSSIYSLYSGYAVVQIRNKITTDCT
jgi:hypothetical protein